MRRLLRRWLYLLRRVRREWGWLVLTDRRVIGLHGTQADMVVTLRLRKWHPGFWCYLGWHVVRHVRIQIRIGRRKVVAP